MAKSKNAPSPLSGVHERNVALAARFAVFAAGRPLHRIAESRSYILNEGSGVTTETRVFFWP